MILQTDLGLFDVLRDVAGVGNFDEVARHTVIMEVEGQPVRVLDFDTLIAAKKAAGREKDLLGVQHFESVRNRQRQQP